jgi:hypothetical protein
MSSPAIPSPNQTIHRFKVDWQFWLITVESRQYKILDVAKFQCAENFAKYYYLLGNPSEFKYVSGRRVSLAVFRGDIRPAWEAAENANGGHWSYEIRDSGLVAQMWTELLLMLLGGELGTDCTGVVCGIKQVDQWVVEVWLGTETGKNQVSEAIAKSNFKGDLPTPKWNRHSGRGGH